jgi:hypothetical protein
MIKHFILSCCTLLILAGTCRSQSFEDTIYTVNTDTLICHITLVNSDNIFYTDSKNQLTYVSKNKVTHFVLNNKNVEVSTLLAMKDSSLTSPLVNPEIKGRKDALKYYHDYTHAGTGTLVISLLSPLAGLIPAIACASTQPKEQNLNYRDSVLIKQLDYYHSYVQTAHKIKKKKVWTNWGVAFGINLFLALTVFNKGF